MLCKNDHKSYQGRFKGEVALEKEIEERLRVFQRTACEAGNLACCGRWESARSLNIEMFSQEGREDIAPCACTHPHIWPLLAHPTMNASYLVAMSTAFLCPSG